MLVTVRERVRAAIARGESADEAARAGLLADLEERWGGGFVNAERLLDLVFEDLAGD